MASGIIKPKSMGLFISDGRLLATPFYDHAGELRHYRLLGGSVEFGETSAETLRREMKEEVDAEVEVLELLAVLENIFEFEGRHCHEINFVHHARFLDDSFNRRDTLPNIEPGSPELNLWLPARKVVGGPVPLYPNIDFPRFLDALGVPA